MENFTVLKWVIKTNMLTNTLIKSAIAGKTVPIMQFTYTNLDKAWNYGATSGLFVKRL
jgi:hypothetical protein